MTSQHLISDFALVKSMDLQPRLKSFNRAFVAHPALATKAFIEHDFIDSLECMLALSQLIEASLKREKQLQLNLELSINHQ